MRRMATHDLTRMLFAVVVVMAIGSALFRVATAPQRIKDRHETARSVCLASGGQWVKIDRDELCQRGAPASRP